MAMMSEQQDTQPQPAPAPVSASAVPGKPLVARVADLESQLAMLTDLHNRFVEAATRELGI